MSKKVTVSVLVTYDFAGELFEEYLEQLHGNEDTASQREWFAIDRFIGHHNLYLLDKKAEFQVIEKEDTNG